MESAKNDPIGGRIHLNLSHSINISDTMQWHHHRSHEPRHDDKIPNEEEKSARNEITKLGTAENGADARNHLASQSGGTEAKTAPEPLHLLGNRSMKPRTFRDD